MEGTSAERGLAGHESLGANVNCPPNAGAEDTTVHGERGNMQVAADAFHANVTKETILQMEFDTLQDAEKFYKDYGRVKGFGVRLDDIYRNKHGEPQARRMVCSAQGERDTKYIDDPDRMREHRALTRCRCAVGMRVRKKKGTPKWEVFRFDDEHNHPTLAPKHIALHRCHRSLTEADIAQVNTMQSYGFKGSQIFGYIAGQSDGYETTGFTKKDMYNHITRERNLQASDGDTMAALHYLRGKADSDPMFFLKYSIAGDGTLENLFWADGNSRIDYKCFGDVLAFDSTYKKNKYNRPLVIFSGVSHHRKTVVFGCGIIINETEETYRWLLTTLIEAMNGKQPLSVVTDGDKAMMNAIKCVLPLCCHRLCSWHLERNATSNIAHPQFTRAFRDCLFGDMTVAQFEMKWLAIIEQFHVGENAWIKKMYKKRNMWAAAYLRGKMFVGLRTTSLCEGVNSYIRGFVKQSHNLVEFMHRFQRWLNTFRYNELLADFKTTHGAPVLTTGLESIEHSGAEVYTREAFWIFCREINLSAACVVADCKRYMTTKTYKVRRFMNQNTVWSVHIDRQPQMRIMCECKKLQSFGLPCQHIIFVLVQEDIGTLPPYLIVQRWTKSAKDVEHLFIDNDDTDTLANLRFGSLIQDCRLMCQLASRSRDSFLHARDNIRNIVQGLHKDIPNVASQRTINHCAEQVLDPNIVQSKGRPRSTSCSTRRRKRCGLCRIEGHTRVTCPLNLGQHPPSAMPFGEGSSKVKQEMEETSLSEQELSLGDYMENQSFSTAFGDDVMAANLGRDGLDTLQCTAAAPVNLPDDDTGMWTLDGQLFDSQVKDEQLWRL